MCDCATVQLGTLATSGSIVGKVTVEGNLDIVNSDTTGITTLTNLFGGKTTFLNGQSAGTIAIENKDSGRTIFATAFGTDTATAGNATIVNRSGGYTEFNAASTAGNATITNRFTGETDFYDNSKAGTATIVNRFGGATNFYDNSSAGSANITNRFGGVTTFYDSSTADNATITNNGSGSSQPGLIFFDASTAGTATIINNSNGLIAFGFPLSTDTASADHATITNSGLIQFNSFTTAGSAKITTNNAAGVFFLDNADGGAAQFITNAGGTTDFSQTIGPDSDKKITAGSIAGAGDYYLGGIQFKVGSNNLSTTVSGTINDGVSPLFVRRCGLRLRSDLETGASLVKVGTGTLTLSGTNTYTGGTTITAGAIEAAHQTAGSIDAFGSGAVILNGGTLRSTVTGTLANNVTANSGIASTISAAAGKTLILQSGTFTLNDNSVTTFGAVADTGTIIFQPSAVAADPTASVVVAGGTLKAGSSALGTILQAVASTTVNTSATIDFNDQFAAVRNLKGSGSVVTGLSAATTLQLTADSGTTPEFSGVISGAGKAAIGGAGTTIFSGDNTYSGGTTICNCATLQLGNGGAAGSILGNVVDNGTFIVNRSDTYSFAGVISEDAGEHGKLVKNGAGKLILPGTSTYSGATTVNSMNER